MYDIVFLAPCSGRPGSGRATGNRRRPGATGTVDSWSGGRKSLLQRSDHVVPGGKRFYQSYTFPFDTNTRFHQIRNADSFLI